MLKVASTPPAAYSAASGEESLRDADWEQTWTPVYTKPRQEKALAWELRQRGVTYFLPMVEKQTVSGGRRRRNLHPLFPSYLFYAGEDAERLIVLRTERVVQQVTVTDFAMPTLRRELAALDAALRLAPRSVELHRRLVTGMPVKVSGGALRGHEAIVVNADNKRKVTVNITALGSSVTLEIAADLLDPYS